MGRIKWVLANEQGVSLVSVTIAAGIMGMLALAMMRMQENQLKAQNDMVIRNEIMGFTTKLASYFQKDDYCQANFKDIKIDETSEVSLDEIINPVERVIYKTGEKYGNNSFKLLSIKQKDFYYDQKNKSSGVLKLMVSMEKSKKATGAKIINKEMEVFLYFDSQGKVLGCGSGLSLTTEVNDPGIDVAQVKKAIESAATTDQDTQKQMKQAIENNPTLKLLQSTIKEIETSNKKFEELEEKYNENTKKLKR